jgi:L-asparagine transporter-like permease
MERELKTTYFRLLVPALLAMIAIFAAKSAGLHFGFGTPVGFAGPLIFILAGTFGLALPIFYRTLFLHRIRHRQRTPAADLLAFERRFLLIALIPAYLAAVGYALNITQVHLAGTVLIALYAAYYYYPSPQRIAMEKRIFRAEAE